MIIFTFSHIQMVKTFDLDVQYLEQKKLICWNVFLYLWFFMTFALYTLSFYYYPAVFRARFIPDSEQVPLGCLASLSESLFYRFRILLYTPNEQMKGGCRRSTHYKKRRRIILILFFYAPYSWQRSISFSFYYYSFLFFSIFNFTFIRALQQ